ncbi:MAG: hypothetical protein RJB01_605 [Actinomycetota bacterium]
MAHVTRTAVAALVSVAVAITLAGPASAGPAVDAARELRSEVTTLSQEYEFAYGKRLSADERSQLSAISNQGTRQLTQLLSQIRRAERSGKRSDWLRAQRLHASATASAETQLLQARTILEPHLSFLERLNALSDYSRNMERFDSLGLMLQESTPR